MGFIEIPNLPKKKVKLAVVDQRLDEACCRTLEELGVELLKTGPCRGVYKEISCHPDICLHHVGGRKIVYAPSADEFLLAGLAARGFELIRGSTELKDKYPFNIAYNVARVGKLAFHNLKYTDPVLARELNKAGVELVHVNQGYTKCAVSVIDSSSIITSDKMIARVASSRGIEVLLIDPDQNIGLYGMSGFIGGASGKLDSWLWAVTGNFSSLKSSEAIKNFLSSRKIEILSLSQGEVMDIGSIIPLLEAA